MCHSIAVLETRSIPSPGQVPGCRTTAPCRRGGTIGTGPEQAGGGLVAGRASDLGLLCFGQDMRCRKWEPGFAAEAK